MRGGDYGAAEAIAALKEDEGIRRGFSLPKESHEDKLYVKLAGLWKTFSKKRI
jgi:hypothetical protein